jgi:hypothetical protein
VFHYPKRVDPIPTDYARRAPPALANLQFTASVRRVEE